MELLANEFSWEILKKIILKAPGESSNSASDEGAAGGDADVVRGDIQQQGDDEMQCNSSSICSDFEAQANSNSSGGSVKPVGEVTGDVPGKDQQQGGDQMPSNRSSVCSQDLEEQLNSGLSENVAAQPLVPEKISKSEKIRATNMKQKEGLLRQLKRDWQGLKESEEFATRGSRKGSKKLKIMEKETFHTRSKYLHTGKSMKQDLGTLGTGLDNGYYAVAHMAIW